LSSSDDDALLLLVLDSLRTINVTDLNSLVVRRLLDSDPRMRRAALEVYQIEDEASLKNVISLLGDDSEDIVKVAREKIKSAGYQNSLRLIKSLSLPQKKVRESLFYLLQDMAVKDLDMFRFVQLQTLSCYQLTTQAKGIRQLSGGALQELLAVHLDERVWFTIETTIRVLAAQDRSGRINQLTQGLFSTDLRQRANSLEAMDDILDKSIVRLLMPLLEHMDPAERIAAGRRLFPGKVEEDSTPTLFENLLKSRNWVTLALTLTMMRQFGISPPTSNQIETLAEHANPHVALPARQLIGVTSDHRYVGENEMKATNSVPLTDKVVHLKKIEIFADLSINELATVAAVTNEVACGAGKQVFMEGERGDTLYLVMEGDVAVIKGGKLEKEIELDSIGAGDYFGEMALFGDDHRSATIRVKKDSRFLTLHKEELQEIVREYPQIALHVCRILSLRIRHLHSKIVDQVC
jgi:HEAT repeat protein